MDRGLAVSLARFSGDALCLVSLCVGFNIATALAALLGIIVLFRDTVTFGARFAIPVSSYAIISRAPTT